MTRSTLPCSLFALVYLIACGSSQSDTTTTQLPAGGTSNSGAGTSGNLGAAGNGVGSGGASAAGASSGGSTALAGDGGAPATGGASGGAAAVAGGGSGGAAAGAGGMVAQAGSGGAAGTDAGDTPAPQPMNITVPADRYVHDVGGKPACIDTTSPIIMGKMIIDLGVDSGGLYEFGCRRGFHTYAVSFTHCGLTYDNREHNGDCRLATFTDEIEPKVKSALEELTTTAPGEGWEYYLNADGSVRWSDVGFTGVSHGAQSAARFGVAVRLYRAVSRSGPRDNQCGDGTLADMDFDPNNPPYDVNCPDSDISAWIDDPPATPIERFFGFVGKQDG
ncbi:MAG TPA: hypothetical protein VHO25_11715, partial [Polyangiaceae bacterium]|nr:hypothetical protein [Polyangiaceae bacterium]